MALLKDTPFKGKLWQQWARWAQQRKYFQDMVMWERVANKQIRLMFIVKERGDVGMIERWKISTMLVYMIYYKIPNTGWYGQLK
jgi:hypothetical protein